MKPFVLLFSITLFLLFTSCSSGDEGAGNCSISCGGFGTGQPFTLTNHPFVSESKCIELAKERNAPACKAGYCPPTGDPDDCYEVYP